METEFRLNRLQFTSDKYDFIWAHVEFTGFKKGAENREFLVEVEVRIPKEHQNLNKIRKIAFERALNELKQSANLTFSHKWSR